ncbi:MAG: glycoside hydrolase family 97 protein [Gemmatimonadota bacterium]|nr:MAG: glycoside hydrolase family 97 protein [Gemmatimonadota bacterium]
MSDINELIYSIIFNNKVLLSESHLSLRLRGGDFSKSLEITNVRRETHDETYDLVVGKSKHVRNHYNEAVISLQEKSGQRRKLDVIFRVYNDGVAFHYSFPEQSTLRDFEILAEHSEFRFLENYICWALELKGFTTNYEDVFGQKTIGAIEPDTLVGLPLTVEIDDGPFLAITEANLRDYAGMYLEAIDGEEYALRSSLSPLPNEDGVCVKGSPPHRSPWRVIMIGEKPGDLIESNIIINLNEPCAISDPSWIKPGKVAWPWWSARTVTDVDFEGGMNTSTMKHYIDFAAEFKLEYLLIDAKWYGAHKDPAQDITTTIPEIDMPHILGYAKERNVDVILWLNWQNTRDQMDRAFPLYEKWGVKGVKVDYMNRDDQEMVDFYHQVVKKAAEHHLLVDFHGSYKPTGMRRTYPNCLTREGVLGLEHTKWSTRVTPEHNVTIPFTRMLAGPMDYTPGAFHNVTETQFRAQYESPMAMGTRCHHLSMFVVYESPLQMCSDYPGAYRGQPGAELLKVVPASWDATRVLAGKIGDYIAVARKHGDEWFIGAMTDWEPRSLKLPLKFLDDREYSALIYADGTEAKEIPSSITQKTIKVRGVDSLSAAMAPGGGYVVHLTPIADD